MRTLSTLMTALAVAGFAGCADQTSTAKSAGSTTVDAGGDASTTAGADATAADTAAAPALTATCSYTNPFSQGAECKAYTGSGWDAAAATADCAAVSPGTAGTFAAAGKCAFDQVLGTCTVSKDGGKDYILTSGGSDAANCDMAKLGCETFAKGKFSPGGTCGGSNPGGGGGGGGGGSTTPPVYGLTPFVQPYVNCVAPKAGEPAGKGPDGKVCTPVLISGCTEEGRRFEDYASCNDVLTNRPYWAAPPAKTTAKDDPRLQDKAYMAEVAWARQQLEASACTCCHSQKNAPGGKASNWYIDQEGIWLDGLKDSGVAIMAGMVDSSSFGAFAAKDNNGFDRITLGAPTTDIPRMQKLLLGEWARRGRTMEDAKQYDAFGGPLVDQMAYVPEACTDGEGVDAAGKVQWQGGDARYVYVLEATAKSPGVPPNLDRPAGTLWFVDVPHTAKPMQPGIAYGQISGDQKQRLPAMGAPAKLEAGKQYYVYVLRDIGFPVTRCLFTAK